jgi:hypothetical protein
MRMKTQVPWADTHSEYGSPLAEHGRPAGHAHGRCCCPTAQCAYAHRRAGELYPVAAYFAPCPPSQIALPHARTSRSTLAQGGRPRSPHRPSMSSAAARNERRPAICRPSRCPQGVSNPRFGLERATSWATRRWGPTTKRMLPRSAHRRQRVERGESPGGRRVGERAPRGRQVMSQWSVPLADLSFKCRRHVRPVTSCLARAILPRKPLRRCSRCVGSCSLLPCSKSGSRTAVGMGWRGLRSFESFGRTMIVPRRTRHCPACRPQAASPGTGGPPHVITSPYVSEFGPFGPDHR